MAELESGARSAQSQHLIPALNFDTLMLIGKSSMDSKIIMNPSTASLQNERRIEFSNLRYVSALFDRLLRVAYPLQWSTRTEGLRSISCQHERVDPINDMVMIHDSKLPQIVPSSVWPLPGMDPNALPMRRLLNFWATLEEFDAFSFADLGDEFVDQETGQEMKLGLLPELRELAVTFGSCGDWWLDGYQLHHPEIIGAPHVRSTWHEYEDKSYLRHASYFKERGMVADTGLLWDVNQWPAPLNFIPENKAGITRDPFDYPLQHTYRPNIGFHGYSTGSSWCGGNWSGYRYHVETHKVEFSPLSFDEVKDIMLACRENTHTPYAFFSLDPQLIAKVFIVRKGETASSEPHHCWEEVKSPQRDETETARRIRALWFIILNRCADLEPARGKMRMDPVTELE